MSFKEKVAGLGVSGYGTIAELMKEIYGSGRPKPVHVITANPEIIWHSVKNASYHDIFSSAEVRVADGVGVAVPMKISGFSTARLPGYEIFLELMKTAGRRGHSVFLIGGTSEINLAVSRKLEHEFSVNVAGAVDGFGGCKEVEVLIRDIEIAKPDIVVVAMGAPRQDFLIARIRRIYSDSLFIGVGGSFDVYSGAVNRAPIAFQRVGLEWLYRLLKDPARLPRYANIARYIFWLLFPNYRGR